MKKRKFLSLVLVMVVLLAACSAAPAAAQTSTDVVESAVVENTANETTTTGSSEAVETEDEGITRSENWTEESHSNDAEPNYDVVFPEDEVQQIKITIDPEDWQAMQENLDEVLGQNGAQGGMGMQQMGERPQPGNMPVQGERPEAGAQPGMQQDNNMPQAPGQRPENQGQMQAGEVPDKQMQTGGEVRDVEITSENPMWVEATIEFEGNYWTNVGVRYKGNSSLQQAAQNDLPKLPLKLDFDEFEDEYPEIDDQRFYGFKQLSLANAYKDTSFMKDAVVADVLEDAELPAAQTAFYEVILDYGEGEVSLGLYTMIEVIDDTVVEEYFGSDDGNIYEAEGTAASFAEYTYDQIENSFEKENNEESDWSDIEALFAILHSDLRNTDAAAWRAELEAIFDTDAFLEWLAITAIIENWDAYGSMAHNYYLYNDPESGQITWISWDHNEAMSSENGGNHGGMNRSTSLDKNDINDSWPMIRYLLDDSVYYEQYLSYLEETINGAFNADMMAAKYQSMAELIAPYAEAEVGEAAFENSVQQLIQHAYQRGEAVEAFLE